MNTFAVLALVGGVGLLALLGSIHERLKEISNALVLMSAAYESWSYDVAQREKDSV